jgi:peptidoglycan/xylan/chitin deacetylase (PgdA/CDA1 family)
MRWDRIVALNLVRPLAASGVISHGQALPILMYHSISDDAEKGVGPYYRVATSPRRFAAQMQLLSGLGYVGVSVEEALRTMSGGAAGGCRPVAITFDDGFRDFYTAAWPVLQAHKFSASMYLPTEFISSERKSFQGHECMTWDEVRELRAQGVQFGSHTVSHPELYKIPWREIEMEVGRSKEVIERELDEEITGFGYPYAFPQQDPRFVGQFKKLLESQGYDNCVTTRIGRVKSDDDHLSLRRLPVNSCDDDALFVAKLDGHYDRISIAQSCMRRMKTWALRRSEYASAQTADQRPI